MRKVWGGIAAAWAAIVALAWWLADKRTGPQCSLYGRECDPALVAVRDYTLIVGLVVPLVFFVVLVVLGLVRFDRLNRRQPRRSRPSASRELQPFED